MTWMRSTLAGLVALSLLLATIGMGSARGAMAAQGELCSVTSVLTVVIAHDGLPLLDADGEPVVIKGEACLDCLIATVALPQREGVVRAVSAASTDLGLSPLVLHVAAARLMSGQPRAPPVAD